MKLYDFSCEECARRFEDLVRDDEAPSCPSCGSSRTARVLSSFSVGAARTRTSAPESACASGACCLGGMCGDAGEA